MILLGDINKGLRECQSTPGSILVDVRERTEFASGHIAERCTNISLLPQGKQEQEGCRHPQKDGIRESEEHRRD